MTYNAEWHRERYPELKARKDARRARNAAIIAAARADGCARCGEDDPCCIDLHHVKGDKKFNLADREARDVTVARLVAEIAKCIPLCANCHRKEHARHEDVL